MGKCEVCHVTIPDGDEAKELHESGKRHIRTKVQIETVAALAERSIFLKWAGSIGRESLLQAVSQFGNVDRLIFREDSSFAMAEFVEPTSVLNALTQGKLEVSGATITVSKRKLNFGEEANEKRTIDVATVSKVASEASGYSNQIDSIIEQIVISSEQMAVRRTYAKRLEEGLSKYFINPRVTIFGSSITSIGTVDSDIDACFELLPSSTPIISELNRDKFTLLTCDASFLRGRRVNSQEVLRLSPADRARFLCKVMNEMRKEVGWIGHQRPVLDARCPVVRFIADKHVLIDLSIDNQLGCAKSEYLRALIETDASGNLRRILLGFRFWALSNQLFEPLRGQHKGHYNAYMLNLLVIGYLQSQGLVPSMKYSEVERRSENWRIDFAVPSISLASIDIPSFFKMFFVHIIESSIGDTVYCVKDGVISSKTDFLAAFPTINEDFKFGLLNVQDPLELSHNVCQNICEKSVGLMRRRMMFSLAILKKSRESFCDLLCLADTRPSSSASSMNLSPSDSLCRLADVPLEVDVTRASEVMCSLFEEVLAFEIDAEPSRKRARTEPDEESHTLSSGPFSVRHRLWVGRRNVRRKLTAANPAMDELALEREVSKYLWTTSKAAEMIVRLNVSFIIGQDSVLNIVLHRIEGDPAEMTNLAHFLDQLLLKNRLRLIEAMGGSHEPNENKMEE